MAVESIIGASISGGITGTILSPIFGGGGVRVRKPIVPGEVRQQTILGTEFSALQLDVPRAAGERFRATPTFGQPAPTPAPPDDARPSPFGGGYLFAGVGTAWWGPAADTLPPDPDYDAPGVFERLPPMTWPAPDAPPLEDLPMDPRDAGPGTDYGELIRECQKRGLPPGPWCNPELEMSGRDPIEGFLGGPAAIARVVARALFPFIARTLGKPPPTPPAEPQVGEIELPEPQEIPKELEREAERAAERGEPFILRQAAAVGRRVPRPRPVADRPARGISAPATLPAPPTPAGKISARPPQISVPRPALPAASPTAAPSAAALALTGLGTGAAALTLAASSSSTAAVRATARARTTTPTQVPGQTMLTTPTTVPAGFPSRQPQRQPQRQKKCQEVKRKRRRKGKCKEGFFRELPGSTQYETWRTRECITGEVISEKETE